MRAADDAFPEVKDYFDPPLYNEEELRFIRDHLGETSYIALEMAEDDDAVTAALRADAVTASSPVKVKRGVRNDRPTALKSMRETCGNALQRFHQLSEMARIQGTEWNVTDVKSGKVYPGFEGIKKHIDRWLKRQAAYFDRKQRDPQKKGFHPEMWTIRDGGPKWSGRGTDNERVRYPLALVDIGKRSYDDFTKEAYDDDAPEPEVVEDRSRINPLDLRLGNSFACPVEGCSYTSEFNPESQMDENRSLAGLKIHMSRPKGRFELEQHHDLRERIEW